MAQKETILGNYTSFSRFPLDCESMEYIQENIKHLAIVAQIAGCDKLIIKGCTGSPRTEGYVYVRTGDDLVGEILYYGGGTGVRCSIATDSIDTTANGETFANAYTKRKLVSGTTGTWAWSEFETLSEITNAALKTAVNGKAASNHTHNYSAPGHTHDDRYYTGSEVDSKFAVTSGDTAFVDNEYRAHWRRQGKVVTLWVTGLKAYSSPQNIIHLYSAPKPAVNVSGVGWAYLDSDISNLPTNAKVLPFTYDTNLALKVGNFSEGTFNATITYITSD